jgi:hypothetical protein
MRFGSGKNNEITKMMELVIKTFWKVKNNLTLEEKNILKIMNCRCHEKREKVCSFRKCMRCNSLIFDS